MRAILSPHDKSGLDAFARGLAELGFQLYATDGTVRALARSGVVVHNVSELTGHPEMLGGRVKTLHPAIHAGLLADPTDPDHQAQLDRFGYGAISLVAVNLYPFRATIESPTATLNDAVEQIDIGGVTLLRAAAKNFLYVLPVVDPGDYPNILDRLRSRSADVEWRRAMAAKAFQHVATYDAHIAGYLRAESPEFPDEISLSLEKVQDLRYGENPHQRAALYRQTPNPQAATTLAGAHQLHGRELSFNNILDVDAAYRCVCDFSDPAVVIVKHGNPCGLGCAAALPEAYQLAHSGDPMSAFGGAVGFNHIVDGTTARLVAESHYDDLIGPGYTDEALAILRRKRNLRIVEIRMGAKSAGNAQTSSGDTLDYRRISGGFLVQTPDNLAESDLAIQVATERAPTADELTDLKFAWRAVKHVRSNAIVLARNRAIVGVGAGQMSRVDSVDLAIRKAGTRASGSVLASDAYFAFADGPELAASAGVTAIIQPGGSVRDDDVVKVANRHNLAMIFTGQRHFKH